MNEGGYRWIAGNLIRNVAALNNMEMLPWDVWGVMPRPGERIDDEHMELFDRLAALTRDPDASASELAAHYRSDPRLTVPDTVFNAVLRRDETVPG